MRLAVFGASGPTGRHIVARALDSGYEVTALMEPSEAANSKRKGLKVVRGSIQSINSIEQALRDVHAVIAVLHTDQSTTPKALRSGLFNIIAGMQGYHIHRLVVCLAAEQGIQATPDLPQGFLARTLGGFLKSYTQPKTLIDIAKNSGLDWTVVHSSKLTDTPASGALRVGLLTETMGHEISHAELATFMLSQVTDATYVHKMPAISREPASV